VLIYHNRIIKSGDAMLKSVQRRAAANASPYKISNKFRSKTQLMPG